VKYHNLPKIYIYSTLWLFNIAMENGPFIVDFPIKTSIYEGFSMAMLNNQMISIFIGFITALSWLRNISITLYIFINIFKQKENQSYTMLSALLWTTI